MTDKHRQTEGWGWGGGGLPRFPALGESPTRPSRGSEHEPLWAWVASVLPSPGLTGWGNFPQGPRCRVGRQWQLSGRLPSNSGEGDLAHYRGGRRIKVSQGWELGVDTEDAVPLETACLVLGYRGPLLGLGDSPLRVSGVLSRPITHRVGVRVEKPFMHVGCVSHTFCQWPCFTLTAAW